MKKNFFVFIIIIICLYFCGCNIKSHSINFVSEDIGNYYTINTQGNEIIKMPEIPQRQNYIFLGWYYNDNNIEKKFKEDSLIYIDLDKNIKVYAKWISEYDYYFPIYNEELTQANELYNSALLFYNYYNELTTKAYDYYIAAQKYYNSIVVKRIRVYRSGSGFVYEDDPDDLREKNYARNEMNEAEQLYNTYLQQKDYYKNLVEVYKSQYDEIVIKINMLGEKL